MTDRIERELSLPASPEEVWDVVTSPGWLADELELELRPGGDARFGTGEEAREGWIEEVNAPERLAFWWSTRDEPATRVELTITGGSDGRTTLRIVETRPLELLDLVGIPLHGHGGSSYGPALVAVGG